MTVINGQTLLRMAPIKGMATRKMKVHGVSYGLSEAGYDIRIKQEVSFFPEDFDGKGRICVVPPKEKGSKGSNLREHLGRFVIASAVEEFQMPGNLVGIVHDKSTWARLGLSVFNTVIEPGWKGFLTLELVFHGNQVLHIPAGAGIAQVIFSHISDIADYGDGKYQNAADRPQEAIKI